MDNILTLKYILNKEGSFGKLWQLFRRHFIHNGFASTLTLWNTNKKEAIFKKWAISKNKKITILATPHTIFIANLISNSLEKIGISSQIEINNNKKKFSENLYFVICPQSFKTLPKNRIVFQLEQSISNRWFSKKHIKKLENSLLVMDYSLKNIEFLSTHLPLSQLYFTPISCFKLQTEVSTSSFDNQNNVYEYDVLFYGDTNNERRKNYLDALKNKYKVKIINNAFGEDIWNEIKKSKVVINIHYYEDALLETTRLQECLSNNAIIVSEKSSDFEQHDNLMPYIDFVEIGDIEGMIERIDFWINHPKEYSLQKRKIYNHITKQQHIFDFYLFRILMSLDLISFDDFYKKTHKIWKPTDQFWCLGLPEAIERQHEFSNELLKYNKIWKFPGVRHLTPWIGCGLSYKYIFQYAIDYNFKKVIICEDDVKFPNDFKETLNKICDYLCCTTNNWDIFSGYITDLHPESNITTLEFLGKYQLIKTNKMTGMVFNIYNQPIFEYIANWDYSKKLLGENAIDRYIENHKNLNVITTIPFIVNHKENVHTTLWNRSSRSFSYCEISENSQNLIKETIKKNSKIKNSS